MNESPDDWSGLPLQPMPVDHAHKILSALKDVKTRPGRYEAVARGSTEAGEVYEAGVVVPVRSKAGKFHFISGNHDMAGLTELLMSVDEAFHRGDICCPSERIEDGPC